MSYQDICDEINNIKWIDPYDEDDEEDNNEKTNLYEDIGADSLDRVEILLQIEKEFNIVLEKEVRKNIVTIQDILNILI